MEVIHIYKLNKFQKRRHFNYRAYLVVPALNCIINNYGYSSGQGLVFPPVSVRCPRHMCGSPTRVGDSFIGVIPYSAR